MAGAEVGWNERIDEIGRKGAVYIGFMPHVKVWIAFLVWWEAIEEFCSGEYHDIICTLKILLSLMVWCDSEDLHWERH